MLDLFPNGKLPGSFFHDDNVNINNNKIYNVIDYDVLRDRPDMIQTQNIQKVIDIAAQSGGGAILFPEGLYRSGALFFKENTSLILEENAILYGSKEISDFPVMETRIEGETCQYFAALINANMVDNFSISGKGIIDGDGLDYWRHFWIRRQFNPQCTNKDEMRPRLVYVSNSNNVIIKDVTLQNSPFWTSHFYRVNRLKIFDTKIYAPSAPIPSPSTDAIDLDNCHEVWIKGCDISVNDDAIALKGGKGPNAHKLSENGSNSEILIEDCHFGIPHSCLTCGSETIHNSNIVMQNCTCDNAGRIFYLKMRPDTVQVNENITVKNIKGFCKHGILFSSWTQFRQCDEVLSSLGQNILLENLDLTCDLGMIFSELEEYSLSNICIKNSNFKVKDLPDVDNFPSEVKLENVNISLKD